MLRAGSGILGRTCGTGLTLFLSIVLLYFYSPQIDAFALQSRIGTRKSVPLVRRGLFISRGKSQPGISRRFLMVHSERF